MDPMMIGIALVVAALAVVVVAGRRGSAGGPVAAPGETIDSDESVLDEAVLDEATLDEETPDDEPIEGDGLYAETNDDEAPYEDVPDVAARHDGAAWDEVAPYGAAANDEARQDDAPAEDEVRNAPVDPDGRAGFSAPDGEALSDDRATPPPAAAADVASADSESQVPETRPAVATPSTTASAPADTCPTCGSPMIERVAKRGPREGRSFMACTRYPTCRTAFEIVGSADGEALG